MSTPNGATRKQWLAVSGALLGAFMAILDVSITNASLQDIQGGLGATLDEGAWISTAYLVSEIIVIPLTGYFTRVFSLKKYLVWNTVIFVIASILCGMARNLDAMIFFRILQGFSGGVLIPMAITIILTQLPKHQQPIGLTLFGVAATFAPCIGPTIGGWLTVNYSWPYIFFINIIPGLALLFLIIKGLEESPMQLSLLKRGDWLGIGMMATCLGSLTVVLEEGVRKDWLGSNLIMSLTWICAISFLVFLYRELTTPLPFINLRLLKRKNFLLATILASIFGYGLYGSIYMLPYFLASVRKLDAEQIGHIIMWQGLPQLLVLPFVPKLINRFDNRVLLGFGFILFGISAVMNSSLTHDWSTDQFFWSQIVRAAGQPFIITPMTSIAYHGIEASEIGSASGLNNMMRNLGGSVGIGSLGAIFNHQYHVHFTRLTEAATKFSFAVQEQVQYRANLLGSLKRAFGTLFVSLNREALVMAFGDSFFVIAILFFGGAFLLIFTNKPKTLASTEVAH